MTARAEERAPFRLAQSSLPPADVPGGEPVDQGSDAAAMVVRLERLENQLRAANGAIEELQNQQHRLEEQLKRFQTDVEFRLNGQQGRQPAAPPIAAQPSTDGPSPIRPQRRSDAFDPNADPNAVGAPRQLGATPPSAPLTNASPTAKPPLDLSRLNPNAPPPPPSAEAPTVIAGIDGPPEDPREQYNTALEAYRAGQYQQAEQQLRAFISKNGSNRLVPDAVFYLGESYFQRSRPREAAEQYLKLSTDYSKAARAPEGMLRLGQALAALGNNDQACATLGEVNRRYPTAGASVKRSVERELQKDHC